MTVRVSRRLRAGTAALTTGLLLGVVPGVATPQAALAATPTRLTLSVNHRSAVAGTRLVLLARLNVANRPVTFYEAYRGHSAHVIFTGRTNARGYVAAAGPARYSATYAVRFAGDAAYGASGAQTTVSVRVAMTIRAAGGAKRKGYRLYRQSKKAYVATAVAPSKARKRVLFRLQVRRGSHYRTIDTRRYTLRKSSAVAISYRGKAGKRYRVRAEYAADSLNARNTTKWIYSRFRR